MNNNNFLRLALGLCGLFLATGCGGGGNGTQNAPPSTSGGGYTITLIPPPPGLFQADVVAINDRAEVAGNAATTEGGMEAYAYVSANGKSQRLDTSSSASFSRANALNNRGQVVGYTGQSDGKRAFLYSGGTLHALGVYSGDTESVAEDINDQGQIVGASGDMLEQGLFLSRARAVRFESGSVALIPGVQEPIYANYPSTNAYSINASGQILGVRVGTPFLISSTGDVQTLSGLSFPEANQLSADGTVIGSATFSTQNSEQTHAFLWSKGMVKDLGALPGGYSAALAVNDSGVVVGLSTTAPGSDYVAFVYRDGKMTDLNTLIAAGTGWRLQDATGINRYGQICGNGFLQGRRASFLLTPNGK